MRAELRCLIDRRASHPGLVLDRLMPDEAGGGGGSKEALRARQMERVIESAQNLSSSDFYARAFERRQSSFAEESSRFKDLRVRGRMTIGLGIQNVLETGLRLHHTYGVPLIPGSALKGLAAHWTVRVLGSGDSEQSRRFAGDGEAYRILFGSLEEQGCIAFEDAWITPLSLRSTQGGLVQDIMTPHHQTWQTDPNVAPSDFDSPIPVSFISVVGTFAVGINWIGPIDTDRSVVRSWLDTAMEVLTSALNEWGVGGKTSSGYGRLSEASAQPESQSGAVARTTKRPSGTKVQVSVIGPNAKGKKGYEVQEEGYPQGALTVGDPPTEIAERGIEPNMVLDVEIHNDDPGKPQYRWPSAPKKPKQKGPTKGRR